MVLHGEIAVLCLLILNIETAAEHTILIAITLSSYTLIAPHLALCSALVPLKCHCCGILRRTLFSLMGLLLEAPSEGFRV